jgi:molybdopterin molybdotransferase
VTEGRPLITLDEALARTLALAQPLATERIPLEHALGRVLRDDARSALDIPAFDKATMDGFAVRVADVSGASHAEPAVLAIREDLPAGRLARSRLLPGTAIRIMTGAPLPPGAEAIVAQEDASRSGDHVEVFRPVAPGANCGHAGEDVKRGQRIVGRGTPLGPAQLGMLAASGRSRVRVTRRPRVDVLSTGSELVRPGTRAGAGRIFDANGYSLVSLARRCGGEARFLGIASDRPSALEAKIDRAAGCDVLLVSGGVSVGDCDLVPSLLRRRGFREVYWEVSIKPGRPVFLGRKGRQVVFALPGNPVACVVDFELLVRPYLDALLGRSRVGLVPLQARLVGELRVRPGRRQFLRARLEATGVTLEVRPFPDQKSGVLRSLTESNSLIDLPGDVSHVPAGATVRVLPLGSLAVGTGSGADTEGHVDVCVP